ncbi:DUF6456 domain-containing protein [Thermaurantiacus sp.]
MIDPKAYPNRTLGRKRLAPADAVDRQLVHVNLDESPLSWLSRRNLLSGRQVAAGERLRRDYHAAQLSPRVTMRWDMAVPAARRSAGSWAQTQAMGSVGARTRFHAAMEAVGPGLADILWRVVCEAEGLEAAERGLRWPARSGKLVLGIALDRLAAHYENQIGQISA